MTREQAINYLICRGFTNEQVGEVVRALTYEPARLSVDEVTALAEWTEKLTKASEDAYNKGYADGMKAQEPKTGEWIEHFDESGKWYECDQCHTDWGGAVNFCPNCGADMRGEE